MFGFKDHMLENSMLHHYRSVAEASEKASSEMLTELIFLRAQNAHYKKLLDYYAQLAINNKQEVIDLERELNRSI